MFRGAHLRRGDCFCGSPPTGRDWGPGRHGSYLCLHRLCSLQQSTVKFCESLRFIPCDKKTGHLPCRAVMGANRVHICSVAAVQQLLEKPQGSPALLVQEKHQINTCLPSDATFRATPQTHGALELRSPDNVQCCSYESHTGRLKCSL